MDPADILSKMTERGIREQRERTYDFQSTEIIKVKFEFEEEVGAKLMMWTTTERKIYRLTLTAEECYNLAQEE